MKLPEGIPQNKGGSTNSDEVVNFDLSINILKNSLEHEVYVAHSAALHTL